MFLNWGLFFGLLSLNFFLAGVWFLMNLKVFLVEYYFLTLMNFEFKFYFLLDWMSMLFSSVVMFISGMVLIYSKDYMSGEKNKVYFCYGVLLFVGSMILMILSPNLLMILLGWDGLGIVSYCLVIFYQNYKSDVAGMVTVMSNRIGDIMMVLSMVFFISFGSLDFICFKKIFFLSGFMIIIAGMTKSAQIPFSAWLPAAMAAPTPVSSLVHSSTLVTAGVYLLIRLKMIFLMQEFSLFLLFLSMMTMLMAGLSALFEYDLKKIIALSTLSQLGLMMTVLSLGESELAFFHLLTHAIFKAMLFLCAGFLIHSSLGGQDIRFMGNFYLSNPLIGVCFSLANLSLFGVPFLSGFYSKDMVLEFMYVTGDSMILFFMLVVSTICTSVYSLRVMYYSLWSGGVKLVDFNYHWSLNMEIPVFVMGVVVMIFGSLLSWIMIIGGSIFIMNLDVKCLNMLWVLVGVWIFNTIFLGKGDYLKVSFFNQFLGSMWFMSLFSGNIFSKGLIGGIYFHNVDNGWVEEVGPQGLYKLNIMMSIFLNWIQVNLLKDMLIFTLFLIWVLI
uniref:NADH dehydrogenase subunit 5 n=1 Tax=Alectorobius rudis TaxID=2058922 RepID=UPI00223847F0|nr:NADH dehydrogenase subunit 5 [Alectorobius rudis]UYB78620.1 NADH dehydrogenase subunit 5 [Alectorobius rudis]